VLAFVGNPSSIAARVARSAFAGYRASRGLVIVLIVPRRAWGGVGSTSGTARHEKATLS
jgi:hypothetical protein